MNDQFPLVGLWTMSATVSPRGVASCWLVHTTSGSPTVNPRFMGQRFYFNVEPLELAEGDWPALLERAVELLVNR